MFTECLLVTRSCVGFRSPVKQGSCSHMAYSLEEEVDAQTYKSLIGVSKERRPQLNLGRLKKAVDNE